MSKYHYSSKEQEYYTEVLAREYLAATKQLRDYLMHEKDQGYYTGRKEATEDIAQALGVKARMHGVVEELNDRGCRPVAVKGD